MIRINPHDGHSMSRRVGEPGLSASRITPDGRKVVCLEREIRDIGESRPQQDDDVKTRPHAVEHLIVTKDFTHKTF